MPNNPNPKNWPLNVPGDPNLTPAQGDSVTIKCDNPLGFTWCYTDNNTPKVFADGFLANGSYGPSSHGPYTAVNPGTVQYQGVLDQNQPCTPEGITATGHTIVVSGTGR
jgi:hypothetical protein